MGGRQFPKPVHKKQEQHNPVTAISMPASPATMVTANSVPAQTEHFNFGDSVGVAAFIVTVLAMALPLWLKTIMLTVGCLGCFVFARKSPWTHRWSRKMQHGSASIIVAIVVAIGIPQLIAQWRSEHPRASVSTPAPKPETPPAPSPAATAQPQATAEPKRQVTKEQALAIISGRVEKYKKEHGGKEPTLDWMNSKLKAEGWNFTAHKKPRQSGPEFTFEGTTFEGNGVVIQNSDPYAHFKFSGTTMKDNKKVIVNTAPQQEKTEEPKQQ